MIVRSMAGFASSLPEDVFEDDHGGFLQPPGKSVVDAVAEIFSGLSCQIDWGPEPANDFCWDMRMTYGGRSFAARINSADRYYFWLINDSWMDKLLARNPPAYLDLLRRFAHALAADSSFSDIEWFIAGRDDVAGASFPFDDVS